jgi:hypothetical protein
VRGHSLSEHDIFLESWEADMKKGNKATKWVLLLAVLCIFTGIATAGTTFYSGCTISMSASASVADGTINETVSITNSTASGGISTTGWGITTRALHDTCTIANPNGLSWSSNLAVNSDDNGTLVDYIRTGGLPQLSWRQHFGK